MNESVVVHRLLRNAKAGVMIDVGAHHGMSLRPFADDGWEVHAFEPDPVNRERLASAVIGRPNVRVVPKALAGKPGRLTLYRSAESSGISALHPFTGGHLPAGQVDVTTLTAYLSDLEVKRVDFLKIDVEGYERFVLDGFPWEIGRPRAILVEFDDAKTLPLGYDWTDLAEELRSRGYQLVVSEWEPIEKYGSAHCWRKFAAYPVRLTDPLAWGNLIAVSAQDSRRLLRLAGRAQRRFRLRELATAITRRRGTGASTH